MKKLQDAGIVKQDHDLNANDQTAINQLPEADVDALVRVHRKMSSGGQGQRNRALGII